MNARNLGVTLGVLGSLFACGGSVAVGRIDDTNAQLQTTQDGKPTGNGSTCSWAGTALLAANPGADVPTSYPVGASFESIDGCNSCSCAAQGIMCTIRVCTAVDAGRVACPAIARICDDGSTATSGPNCELLCPDGGVTVTDGGSFASDASACPAIVKLCPDGSSVSPTGPSCTFPACPTMSCASLTSDAESGVANVASANLACKVDSDCEIASLASNCFDACSTPLAKAGETAFDNAIAAANANQCKTFASQGCQLVHPPCVAPGTARCVNDVCIEQH